MPGETTMTLEAGDVLWFLDTVLLVLRQERQGYWLLVLSGGRDQTGHTFHASMATPSRSLCAARFDASAAWGVL